MCSYFMRSPVDELGLMCDVSNDLRRVRRRTKPSYGSSYPADGTQAVLLIGVASWGKGAVSQTELHEVKTAPSSSHDRKMLYALIVWLLLAITIQALYGWPVDDSRALVAEHMDSKIVKQMQNVCITTQMRGYMIEARKVIDSR